MTDPVLRAFREAARHGIDSIGEERLKAMLSKWLDTDGPAAFRAAADSGMIVRAEGTDNSGSPLWRLKGGSATALLRLRARVLEAQIRVRALPAAKFRPRPGEKPDKDGWAVATVAMTRMNQAAVRAFPYPIEDGLTPSPLKREGWGEGAAVVLQAVLIRKRASHRCPTRITAIVSGHCA